MRLQERKTRSVQERQRRGSGGPRAGGMERPCLPQGFAAAFAGEGGGGQEMFLGFE